LNRAVSTSGSPLYFTDARRARQGARLVWLDVFRGLAVLVMIETHVVNTFLAAALREGSGFALLNYFNGLVAPSFLFIAGFTQGMERRKTPGKPINYARRLWRLLGIAALGYALHFPTAELLQHRWADALRVGSQVDVLQCLALGLGLLLGVGWLVDRFARGRVHPRPASFSWSGAVVVLAMLAVLFAPLVQNWSGGPIALRAWINHSTGSLFPIFPWIGFVFLGALAGAWPERPLAERTVGMIGLAVAAWTCRGAIFSAVSPSFFLERAVWVLALAALCEWSAQRRWPAFVLHAGKNSLKLYVAHLLLIPMLIGAGISTSALGLPRGASSESVTRSQCTKSRVRTAPYRPRV